MKDYEKFDYHYNFFCDVKRHDQLQQYKNI